MYGPNKTVDAFIKSVGGAVDTSGYYAIDCAKTASLPDLVFKIDGVSMNVTSKQYARKSVTLNKCIFFMLGDDIDIWYIASSFIARYYTIFDMTNKQIGFAKSK